MAGSAETKTFAPSQWHLKRLQREGRTPKSDDFRASISVALVGATVWALGPYVTSRALSFLELTLNEAAREGSNLPALAETGVRTLGAVPAGLGLLALVATGLGAGLDGRGFSFVAKRCALDLERINPVEGLKKMYGLSSWVRYLVSVIKAILIFGAAALVFYSVISDLLWAPTCGLSCAGVVARIGLSRFAICALVVFIAFGLVDLFVSRRLFEHDNKMGHSDKKEEGRSQFGDPEVRKELSRLRANSTGAGTEKRKKQITLTWNNEAVIVSYDPQKDAAPVVVARVIDGAVASLLADPEIQRTVFRDETAVKLLRPAKPGEQIPRDAFSLIATCFLRV